MDDSEIKLEPASDTEDLETKSHPPPSAGGVPSLTEAQCEKLHRIREACRARDRPAVIELAILTDGLITDDVRAEAWPVLLGYDIPNTSEGEKAVPDLPGAPASVRWEDLPAHEDEGQVKLDVNRSFIYYPTNMSPRQLDERKKELSDVIVEVLRRHPMLHYFQGFHDICQVILLVLGRDQAAKAVEHIALLRIRDFMLPSMQPSIDHLRLLFPLLNAADAKLCAHLSRTQPFFALAATLTLYAHDIQEYSNIARLFDVFMALDPVFPLYIFAEIILQRREELFDIPNDEPEMLHSVLSKLPKPLDLEGLIERAVFLLRQSPPEKLSTWRQVSPTSVLKTSRQPLSGDPRLPAKTMTLQFAEELFHKQCQELARAKRRKEVGQYLAKHKTKIFLGVSVIIGLSSIAFALYTKKSG